MKRHNKSSVLILIYILIFSMEFAMPDAARGGDDDMIWPAAPVIFGESAVVMEAETGAVIYMKDANSRRYPASITKIITAALAIEYGKTGDKVVFSDEAVNSLPADAAKAGVVPGEELMLTDCLYALILRSGNEVANALAEYVESIVNKAAGGEKSFAGLMNDYAKRAGAKNTNFVNPSGLHDSNHYTTAYDMALIAKEAVKNQALCDVWGAGRYTMPKTNKNSGAYDIWHRHSMLVKTRAEYYEYAKGGKTGYTGEAGNTLVTYAKKDDMSLICVVMRSDTGHVYKDTKTLLEYGFNNFKKISVAENDTRFNAGGSRLTNIIKPDTYGRVVIPRNSEIKDFDAKIVYSSEMADSGTNAGTASGSDTRSGFVSGRAAGELRYMYRDYYLGKTDLYFSTDMEQYNYGVASDISDKTEDGRPDVIIINIKYIIAIFAAIFATAMFVIFFRMTGSGRKQRGRERYNLR